MYFLQAVQAPVPVTLGSVKLVIPKFEMDDLVQWAAKSAEEKNTVATEGMDDSRRAQYMAFYGQISVDFEEAKRLVRTPLGVEHVLRVCLPRATVFRVHSQKGKPPREEKLETKLTPEQIDGLIQVNGIGRLAGLAWVLADLDETAVMRVPEKDASEDPLTLLASAGSAKSVETGPSQSQSSKPLIKVRTGEK
jgi:hypothetical protein